jgi:hypothetical protein
MQNTRAHADADHCSTNIGVNMSHSSVVAYGISRLPFSASISLSIYGYIVCLLAVVGAAVVG